MHAAPYFIGSASTPGPPSQLRISPVDPFQHVSHLRRRDRYRAFRGRWPNEPPAVQALCVKRQSNSIVPEDLGQVAATASEDVEIASMRIAVQTRPPLGIGIIAAPAPSKPATTPPFRRPSKRGSVRPQKE